MPHTGSVVVVVASEDEAAPQRIAGILKEHEFQVLEGLLPNTPIPAESLLKPSAFIVQVDPDPVTALRQVASVRSQDPDVPILFAVERNTEQLEINVRQMGIQYYMLLPAEPEELTVVVNCLARA